MKEKKWLNQHNRKKILSPSERAWSQATLCSRHKASSSNWESFLSCAFSDHCTATIWPLLLPLLHHLFHDLRMQCPQFNFFIKGYGNVPYLINRPTNLILKGPKHTLTPTPNFYIGGQAPPPIFSYTTDQEYHVPVLVMLDNLMSCWQCH